MFVVRGVDDVDNLRLFDSREPVFGFGVSCAGFLVVCCVCRFRYMAAVLLVIQLSYFRSLLPDPRSSQSLFLFFCRGRNLGLCDSREKSEAVEHRPKLVLVNRAGPGVGTLTHSHTHTHSHTDTLTHTHTHTLTPSHPHTLTPAHPHTLTLTQHLPKLVFVDRHRPGLGWIVFNLRTTTS